MTSLMADDKKLLISSAPSIRWFIFILSNYLYCHFQCTIVNLDRTISINAVTEKAFLAEKHVAYIRALVIIIGTAGYFLMDRNDTLPSLAYPLLALIWLYGGFVLFFEPYRKYPIMLAAWFTYISDSVFATLWLYATGGIDSPFYVMFYTSIIAVAFRFSLRVTLLTATLYTVCYLLLAIFTRRLENSTDLIVVRTLFIYAIGYFAAVITRETQQQVQARLLIKSFNEELEKKVVQRTRELADSLKRTEAVIEAIPQMAWVSEPDGNVTYLNKAWYSFTGASDLSGWNWEKHIYPEDHDRTYKAWTEALANATQYEIEYRWVRHDGAVRWMLGRANPIYNHNGEITMWIGTATDIHERKMQEQRKDDFMSIASHELKTPLTSIKAYVQLLESKLPLQQETGTYVRKVTGMVERLNGLVSDLLDVSKLQTGKLQFSSTDFDFDTMVDETIEHVQHTTTTHRIIKKGTVGKTIRGDQQRIEQVLNNYLTNAIKYSPKADEVLVEVGVEDQDIVVAVTDRGIGIDKESQARLFERFYRVEGMENRFQGLGIGLYIASEIVHRHNGKAWVKSEPGTGSTFYFSLPV